MDLNVVVESNIPFARGVLEGVASVRYLAPEEITAEVMHDADALVTRTRTRCDAALLGESRCGIVASATIGLDHVDMEWCREHGITVSNAPGCNAPAVAQYVIASLQRLYGENLAGMKLGIVGVGHVGSIVERWAEGLGIEVLPCDPPRAEREGGEKEFFPLSHLAQIADAITFHTPLTRTGQHATWHLADEAFYSGLRRRPAIVNSARGGVTDTVALKSALRLGKAGHAVIDCWEGEPGIDRELLAMADVATPHIAGYSLQGKIRATHMALSAVCRHFGLAAPVLPVAVPGEAPARVTSRQIADSYSPWADTEALKNSPERFEWLRNNYALRDEPMS